MSTMVCDPELSASTQTIHAQCCVVGGGPAGMMLGYLLARAGVQVVVLEKHGDFLRDFRGDTIHPSTLEVMHELGLLDEFLKQPHNKFDHARVMVNGESFLVADLSHLPTHCKYIALMPQWDFLNFLAAEGRKFPTFDLHMQAKATGLVREGERVVGVDVDTPNGPMQVRADLVVSCDGRHSMMREEAGFVVRDIGAAIDVLWMRLPKGGGHPEHMLGYVGNSRMLVLLDRGDYFQCGYVIAKGGFDTIRSRGIEALRDDLVKLAPVLKENVQHLTDWDQVRLLTVKIDRLEKWHMPGLLCIGDAAHAMSPAGGVGVNFAVQDAVATANLLAGPLLKGNVTDADLASVQRRREWPMAVIQRIQAVVHNKMLNPNMTARQLRVAGFVAKMIQHLPFRTRLVGRFIGMGPRPEHVHTPAAAFKTTAAV
jgi:2-polyprenyl-6-methoxyphenol hydroxylase-like FAD-dependent oxidoreductase